MEYKLGRTVRRRSAVLSAVLVGGMILAACSSTTSKPSAPPTTSTKVSPSAVSTTSTPDLASVCPNPIEIELDWGPETEQAAYYGLAAPTGGTINASAKNYTAPLIDPFTGKSTGVKVKLQSGGPAVGYLHGEQYLYEHTNDLLAAGGMSTEIADEKSAPTISIVTPLRNPVHVLFWNPAKYHFTGLAAIGKSGIPVYYYTGVGFIPYLISKGIIKQSQARGGYTGSPASFVASGGGIAVQGYATEEPYIWSHLIPAWDKPIAYQLVSAVGDTSYPQAAYTRPQELTRYSKCFDELVPMIQKSELNYIENPEATNSLIVKLAGLFKINVPYTMGLARYGDETMLRDRIVSQPSVGAFGSFNMARITTLIDNFRSSAAYSSVVSPKLEASDVATNQFVDSNLKMTFYHGPYNNTKGVIIEK